MDVVKARWSSSSFLMYFGAFVVLFATVALLGWLGEDYGDGAFFGWSVLVFLVLAVVAAAFELQGDRVAAGLFAFVSLIAFSVTAGSFLALINILDENDTPFDGFNWSLWLLELIIVAAAFILLARYQFPLLVLVPTVLSWLFLVDLFSGGGDWSAVVSIVIGLFLMLVGAAVDRLYGFWIHVVAGLAIGGAFLYLWHSADWEWILIGLIALFYVLIAAAFERSSYAVLGALGLYLAWSHFVDKWTDTSVNTPIFPEESITPSISEQSGDASVWGAALLYALYGFVIVGIGLWLERRRPAEPEHTAA
ncbi:MAG TPA: hypothetical protein VFR32_10865 [Gaiellaceae bacterium]|nr:hypothetical protein [Gaiellaceae bacterium]